MCISESAAFLFDQLRDQLTQDVAVAGEYAGQMVDSLSPWGDRVTGYITGMESTFTATGHRANIQIRGVEVPL